MDPTLLIEDIVKDESNIAYLESGGLKPINDLVENIVKENSILQTQISDYEAELLMLQNLLLFDELPPEDKLKKINEIYAAKTNDK